MTSALSTGLSLDKQLTMPLPSPSMQLIPLSLSEWMKHAWTCLSKEDYLESAIMVALGMPHHLMAQDAIRSCSSSKPTRLLNAHVDPLSTLTRNGTENNDSNGNANGAFVYGELNVVFVS